MSQHIPGNTLEHTSNRIWLIISAAVLHGLVAIGWTLSTPSDLDARRFLGYSALRWAMVAVVVFVTALFSLALGRLKKYLAFCNSNGRSEPEWLIPAISGAGLLLFSVVIFASMWVDSRFLVFMNRVTPLIFFFLLISLEMMALSWAARDRSIAGADVGTRKMTLILWVTLLALALTILLTRFGLVSVSNGWYEYGVPLMHDQVYTLLLCALIGMLLLAKASYFRSRIRFLSRLTVPFHAVDLVLAGLISLAAILSWSPMPVPKTWMSPKPVAPNNEVYPYSDAAEYDSAAQGILLKTAWGLQEVHYKPFYVAFLTLAHALAGYQYLPVIQIQVFLLALFPALLYWLGKLIHSRLAGLLIGAAAVIREYNQLAVSSLVTVSCSKIMLSELPTALGISVLLVILILWFRKPHQKSVLPVLAGGVIGFIAQIRLQGFLFLPALVVLLLLYYRPRYLKRWLAATSWMVLGFCISLALLVFHNWITTGLFTIEKPGYFERTLTYSYTPNQDGSNQPAQNQANQGVFQSFNEKAFLVGSHFVHNLVHTLLVLPTGYGAETGWTRSKDLSSTFWVFYLPPLTFYSAIWIIINLGVIALGIQAAWRKCRRLALFPLLILIVYDASSALGGFSGQRFFLPVDWIGYFYFFIGAACLCAALLKWVGWTVPRDLISNQAFNAGSSIRPNWQRRTLLISSIALIFVIGDIYPLLQIAIPVKYQNLDSDASEKILANIAQSTLSKEEQSQLADQLSQPGVEILHGIALYPRMMRSIEDSAGVTLPDGVVTFPYLSYTFESDRRTTVLQPAPDESIVFPHASEVIVVGRIYQDHFDAFATVFPEKGYMYLSSIQGDK